MIHVWRVNMNDSLRYKKTRFPFNRYQVRLKGYDKYAHNLTNFSLKSVLISNVLNIKERRDYRSRPARDQPLLKFTQQLIFLLTLF